jgi:hypothetical protein
MEKTAERELSFKTGFLMKLARNGVLPSALFKRVKEAGMGDPISRALGGFYGEAKGLGSTALGMSIPAAKLIGTAGVMAPLGLGALTGATTAKLTSPPEPDIEALRKEELIKLYRRKAKEIRMRRRLRGSGI